MPFYLYILECNDGSYYVGQAENVEARLALHRSGKGAAHTAQHLPVFLVYTEEYQTREAAVKRELQIKRWSRAKKAALIVGDVVALKRLSRRK